MSHTRIALLALVALAAVTALARAADVSVTGNLPGTQHSPSVAMTHSTIYVSCLTREDGAPPEGDRLMLFASTDGGATFAPQALPELPAGWYWIPNACLAYDPSSDQLWLATQARSPATGHTGVFVANGTPQSGGALLWDGIVQITDAAATTSILPLLAMALDEGGAAAQVLYCDLFTGSVRHWRVPAELTGVTSNLIAPVTPGVSHHLNPAIAGADDGRVLTIWEDYPGTNGAYPIWGRESSDGGSTFGPVFAVGERRSLPDPPGNAFAIGAPFSAIYARVDPFAPAARFLFTSTAYEPVPGLIDPMDVWITRASGADPALWDPFGGALLRGFGFWEVLPAAVYGDDGYFYLGWHDFEPFAPDSLSRFMVVRSHDGGYSSGPIAALAATTFDWNTLTSNFAGMGWCSGADVHEGRVAFAWGDHRDGTPDVRLNSFRAEEFAFAPAAGAPDTVDATPGSIATFAFRLENRNELFGDTYAYGVGGPMPWLDGLPTAEQALDPEASADVSFDVAVPDTAANGVHLIGAYAFDHVRTRSFFQYLRITGSLVDVPSDPAAFARGVALAAPRPNPSDGPAALAYTLPVDADVELAIHDLHGRRIATLAHGRRPAGEHTVSWDGRGAGAGVYFARLAARPPGATALVRERRIIRLR